MDEISCIFLVAKGLSNDDIQVSGGTASQTIRPSAGFKTCFFDDEEMLGGATVVRMPPRPLSLGVVHSMSRERGAGDTCRGLLVCTLLGRSTIALPDCSLTKSPDLKPAHGRPSRNTVHLATPTSSSFDSPLQTRTYRETLTQWPTFFHVGQP